MWQFIGLESQPFADVIVDNTADLKLSALQTNLSTICFVIKLP